MTSYSKPSYNYAKQHKFFFGGGTVTHFLKHLVCGCCAFGNTTIVVVVVVY